MTTVVSDASPLINLARIGHLSLLARLFARLCIPQAVYDEVVVQGSGQPGAAEVAGSDWITVQAVTNPPLVRVLRQELDAGEAEAIALGLECGADLLLMDERMGREVAGRLGLRCVGLVGVLLVVKRAGLIPGIREALEALRDKAGFRLSETLCSQILSEAGEE